jgi:hypothetical protein
MNGEVFVHRMAYPHLPYLNRRERERERKKIVNVV